MVTLLTEARVVAIRGAAAEGERLWLPETQLESALGWTLEPEGLCRDGACVPIPPARRDELLRPSSVDVAAFWRYLGKPVLHSADGSVWVLGEGAEDRAAALESLEAPDFTLPDPQGRPHSLSEQRGRKVLLVTWASW